METMQNKKEDKRGAITIEVDGLKSVIDDKVILSNVNFQARRGEITAILGISGSGKTTVLKHLLGLYSSESTAVKVLDQNPSELEEGKEKEFYQQIGVLYQEGALLNSLTVGENIGLPLEQHTSFPKDLIESIVRYKLSLVQLEDAYFKYPAQLSGGMLKRAAIARAIVLDPPLLFCDEPGAGLDPVSLLHLDKLILDLKNQLGITVIMITHEVHSVIRMADQIVFLEEGNSLFHGSLSEAQASAEPALKEFFSSVS